MEQTIAPKRLPNAAYVLIPLIIAASYLLIVARYSAQQNDGYIGALLDDTWIHVRFADHSGNGEGLTYNDGIITTGATSPLWVLTLGAVFAVTNPSIDSQIHIAIALSALGNLLAVFAITRFGWWVTKRPWIGMMAGILTALTGRFIWMGLSGMEITTFTALCIFALWSHMADVRVRRVFGWRTGILAALATLGRPEGYLLTLILGLDAFVLMPLREGLLKDGLRPYLRHIFAGWRGIFAYVLLAGSYPLVCLLVSGYPLPNTFRAKSQLGQETPDLLYGYLWTPLQDFGPLVVSMMFFGILMIWGPLRRSHDAEWKFSYAWAIWPIVFVIAVLFLGPQHFVVNNGRYVAPAIPFNALLASIGAYFIWQGLKLFSEVRDFPRGKFRFIPLVLPILFGLILLNIKETDSTLHQVMSIFFAGSFVFVALPVIGLMRHRLIVPAMGMLCLILIGCVFVKGKDQGSWVAQNVGQLEQMHVAAAEFIAANSTPGQTIALNDVGAIAHITDLPVLDMIGLVSPEVLDVVEGLERGTCEYDLALARLMLDEPPAMIGVFPWFFPCLTGWEGVLQPFAVFSISGTTVIAGGEMVIYWPVWENWPMQTALPDDLVQTEVRFTQGITLAGLKLQQVSEPDDAFEVSLWWRADGTPEGDYTAFVHLIDAEGNIIAQSDLVPQNGQFHTQWWRIGDLLADKRRIASDELAHVVALRIGLYPSGGGSNLLRVEGTLEEPDFVVIPVQNVLE